MDQLLSYYNLLKDSNNESKELINDDSVMTKSREQLGEPSERDKELLDCINTFQARSHLPEEQDTFQEKHNTFQARSHHVEQHNNNNNNNNNKYRRHKEKPVIIEEINTPGVEAVIIEESNSGR